MGHTDGRTDGRMAASFYAPTVGRGSLEVTCHFSMLFTTCCFWRVVDIWWDLILTVGSVCLYDDRAGAMTSIVDIWSTKGQTTVPHTWPTRTLHSASHDRSLWPRHALRQTTNSCPSDDGSSPVFDPWPLTPWPTSRTLYSLSSCCWLDKGCQYFFPWRTRVFGARGMQKQWSGPQIVTCMSLMPTIQFAKLLPRAVSCVVSRTTAGAKTRRVIVAGGSMQSTITTDGREVPRKLLFTPTLASCGFHGCKN